MPQIKQNRFLRLQAGNNDNRPNIYLYFFGQWDFLNFSITNLMINHNMPLV